MVTAVEWLKKSESKRSKKPNKFEPVRRRAWDYIDEKQETSTHAVNNTSKIWEQKEEQYRIENRNNIGTIKDLYENKIGNIQEQKEEQNDNENKNENRNNLGVIKDTFLSEHSSILDDHTLQKRLLTLSGHQREVMRHVTSHLKSRVGESNIIDIIPNILGMKISANIEVTRIALKRLALKKILIKLPGERGRNGCSKFKIQENVLKTCFILFNDPPCDINIINNEIGNKNRNNIPYSSSSYNIKTTTMPENWEQIDFQPLTQIGFTRNQLLQLYEKQLNVPDVIQESIHHFAFGLENNQKTKAYHDPLNVFMGVLRKGQRWLEPSYIPAKDLALQQILEEKKKLKEKRDRMIKEFVELEFPEWKSKLTEEDIQKLVPEELRQTKMQAPITAFLRTYYIDKILLPKLEKGNI